MTDELPEIIPIPEATGFSKAMEEIFCKGKDARRTFIVEGWRDGSDQHDPVEVFCKLTKQQLPKKQDFVLDIRIHESPPTALAAWVAAKYVVPSRARNWLESHGYIDKIPETILDARNDEVYSQLSKNTEQQ